MKSKTLKDSMYKYTCIIGVSFMLNAQKYLQDNRYGSVQYLCSGFCIVHLDYKFKVDNIQTFKNIVYGHIDEIRNIRSEKISSKRVLYLKELSIQQVIYICRNIRDYKNFHNDVKLYLENSYNYRSKKMGVEANRYIETILSYIRVRWSVEKNIYTVDGNNDMLCTRKDIRHMISNIQSYTYLKLISSLEKKDQNYVKNILNNELKKYKVDNINRSRISMSIILFLVQHLEFLRILYRVEKLIDKSFNSTGTEEIEFIDFKEQEFIIDSIYSAKYLCNNIIIATKKIRFDNLSYNSKMNLKKNIDKIYLYLSMIVGDVKF